MEFALFWSQLNASNFSFNASKLLIKVVINFLFQGSQAKPLEAIQTDKAATWKGHLHLNKFFSLSHSITNEHWKAVKPVLLHSICSVTISIMMSPFLERFKHPCSQVSVIKNLASPVVDLEHWGGAYSYIQVLPN